MAPDEKTVLRYDGQEYQLKMSESAISALYDQIAEIVRSGGSGWVNVISSRGDMDLLVGPGIPVTLAKVSRNEAMV